MSPTEPTNGPVDQPELPSGDHGPTDAPDVSPPSEPKDLAQEDSGHSESGQADGPVVESRGDSDAGPSSQPSDEVDLVPAADAEPETAAESAADSDSAEAVEGDADWAPEGDEPVVVPVADASASDTAPLPVATGVPEAAETDVGTDSEIDAEAGPEDAYPPGSTWATPVEDQETDAEAPAIVPDDGAPGDEAYGWPSPPGEGRRRFLPWLDWKFSILLPVAVLLILASAVWQLTQQTEVVAFTVQDSSTGAAIPGAELVIGNDVYVTDADGVARIERPDEPVEVSVSADGYISVTGELTGDSALSQTVSLRPSSLAGQLTDEKTGEPIAGASVTVVNAAGEVVGSTETDESGTYRLENVPEGATVQINAGTYGILTQAVGSNIELSFPLTMQSASGVIVGDGGEPIQGAVVRSGDATAVTGGDGTFTIDGVGDGDELAISAAGFENSSATVSDGRVEQVAMTPRKIRGVYANLGLLGAPGGLDQLIEIANTTEINAIVIDIKQDTIYYDSQVQFFVDAGTVRPIYDVAEVIQTLKDNGIYAIARLVVFQDPLVAEARPDLAVHDVRGDLWRNENGVAWVSAFHEELWDANIALAVEAIGHGFDEVQYDYVRFPSDGDLTTADFGEDYTAEAREAAITEFMKRSHDAISGAGGFLSADLFGFVTIQDDEQYIGQRFSALEPHLDFVSMMIYPSHFETGNIASAPGHPNDYPYETIFESLQRAEQIVPGSRAKFRPWLQDFSYWGLREYTAVDVRAQIDAAEEFGASGWLLWGDPFDVTVEALEPEPAT